MQLVEFYNQCLDNARRIPGFVEGRKEDVGYDIDIITNKYCEALDNNWEDWKNSYVGAFFIRYWHVISYYKNTSSNVSLQTIVEWLFDGFHRACKYRNWLKDPKLINNRRGAEICINNAIDTSRKRFYKASNAQKRKNYFYSDCVISLDSLEEAEADSYLSTKEDMFSADVELVNKFLAKGDYASGIVLDLLMNSESYLNSLTLNKNLHSINNEYKQYFIYKYKVNDLKIFDKIIKKFSERTGRSLSGFSRKTMLNLKKSPILKEFLQNSVCNY